VNQLTDKSIVLVVDQPLLVLINNFDDNIFYRVVCAN